MSSVLETTLVLPHLEVQHVRRWNGILTVSCRTERRSMACPSCASECTSVYDQRRVRIRDEKIRNYHVWLEIWKKRYFCPKCKKPKTEPIDGVLPGRRTTQRLRKQVQELCSKFSCLKDVREEIKCSNGFVYDAFFEQLDLELRKRSNVPWSDAIGIDEHSFRKRPGYGGTEFAVMVVDHRRKKPVEIVQGKTAAALEDQLSYIQGRENVKAVTLDLCDPFKKFAREHFPNAELVADKFHVLRLLNPALTKARKAVTGDRRTLKIRTDLQASRIDLPWERRSDLDRFILNHPELYEIYWWKERLAGFYRIRGHKRAEKALRKMLDEMAHSRLKAVKRLRKTLLKWKNEILNYFKTRLTNARVEGFNNVAKTVKKRGYGFRSFENYRLRVLNACF
jgi:transposase